MSLCECTYKTITKNGRSYIDGTYDTYLERILDKKCYFCINYNRMGHSYPYKNFDSIKYKRLFNDDKIDHSALLDLIEYNKKRILEEAVDQIEKLDNIVKNHETNKKNSLIEERLKLAKKLYEIEQEIQKN